MSHDVFRYVPGSRIHARLSYSPFEARPGSRILVRNITNNQIALEIEVPDDKPIDLTACVQSLAKGIVEAHLTRTGGDGLWTAVLHLYALPSGSVRDVKASVHGDSLHLAPSIQFRRENV